MKGTTVYYIQSKPSFSIHQDRLQDMMVTDTRSNPMLWWSECLICQDYTVCGLDTLKETLEIAQEHAQDCHK